MGRVSMGYLLMLFLMTYNVWIYVSITLGAGVGYYLTNLYKQSRDQHVTNQNEAGVLLGEVQIAEPVL